MRIAVGDLMHETHTFSNVRTFAEPFQLREGADILDLGGTNASIGRALDSCLSAEFRVVPRAALRISGWS